MRLILPKHGDLQGADRRLLHLAEFLGIACQSLALPAATSNPVHFFERLAAAGDSCLVVNPVVIKAWLPACTLPADLGRCLTSRFRGLLVHNLDSDPFTESVVCALSGGAIDSIGLHADRRSSYAISAAGGGTTGPFAGLAFGTARPAERVFEVRNGVAGVMPLISIAGRASLASVTHATCRAFFLGGAEVADLDVDVADVPLAEYFSQVVPPAMALRALCPDACWVPSRPQGTLIIDDPLLQRRYGFLNYERLLALMDQHNFHTTIAFIPHNCKRSSPAVVRMFRARPDRLSICYQGNDHLAGEFAEPNLGKLNAMLLLAETRMREHAKRTGIECDRVMVFPNGRFSAAAMASLRAHNFVAAANSLPYAAGEAHCLPLAQNMQPAVMTFGNFPLFLRGYVRDFQPEDIAYNVFFGRPILVVEHHEIFRDPASLIGLVSRINERVSEIHWCGLQAAVSNSYLTRWTAEGVLAVRMFASEGWLENFADAAVEVRMEWNRAGAPVDSVLVDAAPVATVSREETRTGASFSLAPGKKTRVSIIVRNDLPNSDFRFSRAWSANAFLRRRLSEFRDNYLSKNSAVLSATKVLQRFFFGKAGGIPPRL